jgi:hypothetical protein
MREKRLSIFVRVCFFEGNRNRGSVVKLENRASSMDVEGSTEDAPLDAFCFGILMGCWKLCSREVKSLQQFVLKFLFQLLLG